MAISFCALGQASISDRFFLLGSEIVCCVLCFLCLGPPLFSMRPLPPAASNPHCCPALLPARCCGRRQAQGRSCNLTRYGHFAVVTCPVAASCFFSRAPTWLSICTNNLQQLPPTCDDPCIPSFFLTTSISSFPPRPSSLPKASIYPSTGTFSSLLLFELVSYPGAVAPSAYSLSKFRARRCQKPSLGFRSPASFPSLLRHTHLISWVPLPLA